MALNFYTYGIDQPYSTQIHIWHQNKLSTISWSYLAILCHTATIKNQTAEGVNAALFSTSYFTGVYLLKTARKEDDVYNYAGSGAVNGGIFAAILSRSTRKTAVGALCGGVAGSYHWPYFLLLRIDGVFLNCKFRLSFPIVDIYTLYIAFISSSKSGAVFKVSSVWVYDTARDAWLSTRRYVLKHSKPRVIQIRKPEFPTKENRTNVNLNEIFSSSSKDSANNDIKSRGILEADPKVPIPRKDGKTSDWMLRKIKYTHAKKDKLTKWNHARKSCAIFSST